MRFRLTAFSVHLLSSACVLTVVLGGLYLGWYYWPGWWLVRVRTVAGIAVLVDVVLGVNGAPVSTAAELKREVARAGHSLALLIQREDAQIYIPIDLG